MLDAIGLTEKQSEVILESYRDTSTNKIRSMIKELEEKDKAKFAVGTHIAMALCYNLLSDSVSLQKEQQLMMEKGDMKDWIISTSLELYKLAGARYNHYHWLLEVEETIKQKGLNKERELNRAQYLIFNERFAEAGKIIDKYLAQNAKDLEPILLKADLEMALGNVAEMKAYEQKALAIDPNAFKSVKDKSTKD